MAWEDYRNRGTGALESRSARFDNGASAVIMFDPKVRVLRWAYSCGAHSKKGTAGSWGLATQAVQRYHEEFSAGCEGREVMSRGWIEDGKGRWIRYYPSGRTGALVQTRSGRARPWDWALWCGPTPGKGTSPEGGSAPGLKWAKNACDAAERRLEAACRR